MIYDLQYYMVQPISQSMYETEYQLGTHEHLHIYITNLLIYRVWSLHVRYNNNPHLKPGFSLPVMK